MFKTDKNVGLHFPGKLQHFDTRTFVANCTRMLPFDISGLRNISVKLMPGKALGISLDSFQKEVVHGSTFF